MLVKVRSMKLQPNFILLAVVLLFSAPATPMNFTPTVNKSLNFTVYRNSSPIGHHRFDFRPKGEFLEVEIDVDLEIKVTFITVFKFTHVASETWENGRLVRMNSETDDDGDIYKLAVQQTNKGMLVKVNGEEHWAPTDILPSNLWNRAILKEDKILHPILGRVLPLTVTKLGLRAVEVPGNATVKAEGFKIDGGIEFQRELWYGPDGRLVEVGFNAPQDGSRITYRLN